MNFGFSEEQNLLRDQVRRFMAERCPMPKVRALMDTDDAFDPQLWQQAGELGWLGLIVPEPYGGSGLGWVDLTVVLEETARGLCPLPIAAHALSVAAVRRCGSERNQSEWLPPMASGEALCTVGLFDEPNWIDPQAITLQAAPADGGVVLSGCKRFVPNAQAARFFLLAVHTPDGMALAGLTRDQVKVTTLAQMDRTKPMGHVTLENTVVPAESLLPMSGEDLHYLTDIGAVLVTAEMVGAAEGALYMTSEYAKERIQFGKPIGQYQGVKHRLADLYVDVESFKSLLYYAAWTADAHRFFFKPLDDEGAAGVSRLAAAVMVAAAVVVAAWPGAL